MQNVTMLWKIFGPVIIPGKILKRFNISKLFNEFNENCNK